jgi:TRAP-type mannitol/chloroaromatic compound transport system permease small subunit
VEPQVFLALGAGLKVLGTLLLPVFALPLVALAFPGLLDGLALRLFRAIDRVTGAALSVAVASGLLLLFATLAVVVLRYAFGLSFTWLNEIMTYSFAAMFMLGSAAAMRDGAHVRVDILRPRFGETGRNWVELAGIYLFLFPICLRLIVTGEEGLARSWLLMEGSRESDGLPILYLFKTLVPVFSVLLMAQGLSEALKAALRITGVLAPEAEASADAGGAHGA